MTCWDRGAAHISSKNRCIFSPLCATRENIGAMYKHKLMFSSVASGRSDEYARFRVVGSAGDLGAKHLLSKRLLFSSLFKNVQLELLMVGVIQSTHNLALVAPIQVVYSRNVEVSFFVSNRSECDLGSHN